VHYNNPVSIALQESASLFPDTPDPSQVVSFGNGFRPDRPDVSSSRCFWGALFMRILKDAFPMRIFRALLQYGSSRRTWEQLLGHLKVGRMGDFFRFDVEFEGPEPLLDSVVDMEKMADMARNEMLRSPDLYRLARRIRAENFVFELEPGGPFRLSNGMYQCTGRILCRLRARTPEFETFMTQLDQGSASFLVGDRVLPGSFHDRSARCEDGNFFKEVRLHMPSRLEPFAISLRVGEAVCHISGSPFTLQRLAKLQKLDTRFGTADHRKRKPLGEGFGEARRKRKLLGEGGGKTRRKRMRMC
jgi:hypothetical protein